jgi:hypothetical protein
MKLEEQMKVIEKSVKNLVILLVNHNFSSIEKNGFLGRLTKEEVETAISEYPGKISMPPDDAYQDIVVYDIYDKNNEARKVEFDLWYDGEVSDLTLSLNISKGERDELTVEIDDIHIL